MGVMINCAGKKAFLRSGEWRSADLELEERLNRLTEAWVHETGGPALDSPNPEETAALAIASRIGARVLLEIPARPRQSARQWFRHRQYKLAFMG
jgi:hypothetical protein